MKGNRLRDIIRAIICFTIGWMTALLGKFFLNIDLWSMCYGLAVAIVIITFHNWFNSITK